MEQSMPSPRLSSQNPAVSQDAGGWYGFWQHPQHTETFDVHATLDARNLCRAYEAYNDVRLLREWLVPPQRQAALLEVGCATGEFARYVQLRYPRLRYTGIDVSQTAIDRAKAKYPQQRFLLTDPAIPLANVWNQRESARPEIVYSKDVAHHQVDPLSFISQLVRLGSDMVILRVRTRDVGPTQWDPEKSCQYLYGGWMPYIVMTLQELVDHLRSEAPSAEIVVRRHHLVLGGQNNRLLPKECYLPQTGTAETAVGVFQTTTQAGRVTVTDQRDGTPRYTWDFLARLAWRRLQTRLREVSRA